MESGVATSPSTDKKFTFQEYIDEMCVYYMSIGVSYIEFWDGDYTQLIYYHKAHLKNVENINHEAWLHGLYIHSAFHAVISNFSSGLNGKKGKAKYQQSPVRITPLTDIEKEIEITKRREALISSLDSIAAQAGQKTLKELEGEE